MNDYTYTQGGSLPQIEPPQRVISLVPSVTESLFDLNLGRRLIAVTDACRYPAQGTALLPRIGPPLNPDTERIIALVPDLVIAHSEENRPQDLDTLRAAGLEVWETFPRTVAEAFTLLWDMMNVFDDQTMVPRIRLLEYTHDWLRGISLTHADHLPRVFVPLSADPWTTVSASTFTHDLLRICGGANICGDLPGADRYPQITLDDVIQHQPEVILLPEGAGYPFGASHIEQFQALELPAAAHHRIHLIDASLLTWHGTRLAHAFDTLPSLLFTMETL